MSLAVPPAGSVLHKTVIDSVPVFHPPVSAGPRSPTRAPETSEDPLRHRRCRHRCRGYLRTAPGRRAWDVTPEDQDREPKKEKVTLGK